MFKQASEHNGYNFIDLFAGAGGLSEGFFQAGFNPIAHVEMDHSAAQTLETRSAFYYLKKQGNLNLYRETPHNWSNGRNGIRIVTNSQWCSCFFLAEAQ